MHTQTQTHTQTHTQIQTQNKPTQIIYTLTYKHLNLDAHKSNLHTRPTHTYNKAVTQNDMNAQWPSAPFSSSYSDRKRVKSREDLPKTSRKRDHWANSDHFKNADFTMWTLCMSSRLLT